MVLVSVSPTYILNRIRNRVANMGVIIYVELLYGLLFEEVLLVESQVMNRKPMRIRARTTC